MLGLQLGASEDKLLDWRRKREALVQGKVRLRLGICVWQLE